MLATWDPAADRFEHFGWGVTPELALRVGRKAGDFELEVDRRRDVPRRPRGRPGIVDVDAVRDRPIRRLSPARLTADDPDPAT